MLAGCCDTDTKIVISVSGPGTSPDVKCREAFANNVRDAYLCPGESATLCWGSSNANTASINVIGPVTPNLPGTQEVQPTSTQKYVLAQ